MCTLSSFYSNYVLAKNTQKYKKVSRGKQLIVGYKQLLD